MYVCMCTMRMPEILRDQRRIVSPLELLLEFKPPCRCWEQNPGPVLLADGPALQPQTPKSL